MEALITTLKNLAETTPLPIYTLLGGLFEEIVAPIPSPLIMMSAGSFVVAQNKTFLYLVFLSLLAGVGKTVGSWLIYWVSDKAEDVVMTRFGKFLGISHKDVEGLGDLFDSSWKDDLILIFLRVMPIFPGAPVSAAAGFIKLNMKSFIRATFIGTTLRSLLFGTMGYWGISHSSQILSIIDQLETVGLVLFALAGVAVLIFLAKKDQMNERLQNHLRARRKKKLQK